MTRFSLTLPLMLLVGLLVGCKSTKNVAEAPISTSLAAALPTPADGSSLLWEISGNGLAKPSYLFGTIHIIGSNDFIFPASWEAALAQTKALYLEIDMSNNGEMMKMMTGGMMKDGKSLKDLVTEEEYDMVKAFFKDSVGMPIGMFDKMKPMLMMSLFYPKMIDGDPKSYEMELVSRAKKLDNSIGAVETVEDQLAMIDQIPLEDQVEMLMAYVENFPREKGRMQEMVDIYTSQDVQALYNFMMDSPEMDESSRVLMLDNRNEKWIPIIREAAAAQPTFFAFGAGHLPGDKGVINLLRQAGYTVTAVK